MYEIKREEPSSIKLIQLKKHTFERLKNHNYYFHQYYDDDDSRNNSDGGNSYDDIITTLMDFYEDSKHKQAVMRIKMRMIKLKKLKTEKEMKNNDDDVEDY